MYRSVTKAPLPKPIEATRELLEAWVVDRTDAERMGQSWRDYRDGDVVALRALLAGVDGAG